jgi:hypothetical protein
VGGRLFTSFAAGPNADDAYRAAVAGGGAVAGSSVVREVPVPAGADPSKLATWIQRVAQDPAAIDEVATEHREAVQAAAILADPGACLAVEMGGRVGERMRARLDASPEDRVYLLFGLMAE